MNSSLTPLILSGSSLSTSSSFSTLSSSRCAKCTAGILTGGWAPFKNWSPWVWLYYRQFGFGMVPWSLPFLLRLWPGDGWSMSSPVGWPSGRPPWPCAIWVAHHRSDHASTWLHDQEGSTLEMKQP